MISRYFLGALTLSIALVTSGSSLASPREEQHPIDIAYDRCQERDPSTGGMVQCAAEAKEQWDAELNVVYKELMARLGDAERLMLREAQRQWLTFRDTEIAFAMEMYAGMEGSMWRAVAADAEMRVTRDRAIKLQHYLDTIMGER